MNKHTLECLTRLHDAGIAPSDALALRRISMTLHRWHELECGDGNEYGSWCIVRGKQVGLGAATTFMHDDDSRPYIEHHHYLHGRGKDYTTYALIPDKELGARKRLAKIMSRYPGFQAYVQTDPRGCALYIMRPDDVKDGDDVSSCYTRGIAVYK